MIVTRKTTINKSENLIFKCFSIIIFTSQNCYDRTLFIKSYSGGVMGYKLCNQGRRDGTITWPVLPSPDISGRRYLHRNFIFTTNVKYESHKMKQKICLQGQTLIESLLDKSMRKRPQKKLEQPHNPCLVTDWLAVCLIETRLRIRWWWSHDINQPPLYLTLITTFIVLSSHHFSKLGQVCNAAG